MMELGFGLENIDNSLLMSSFTKKVSFSLDKELVREVAGFSFANLGREMTMEIELNNPFLKLVKNK